jgi:hypothetical protein
MTLGIQRKNITRVFRHRKHVVEGDAAIRGQELQQQSVLLTRFDSMFNRGARSFVCPAWQRASKVGSEDGVRDFVWQDAIQNSLCRTLH